MAFKTLFLAHAPDADYEKHQSVIDTGKYKLWTFVVKNQEEAIKVSVNVARGDGPSSKISQLVIKKEYFNQ